MIKNRIATLAVVAACVLGGTVAAAQHMLADFSGKWSMTTDGPEGPVDAELTMTQTGNAIDGKFLSEIGEAPFKGSVKGDSIRVAFDVDIGGQVLALEVLGALTEKDKMAGVVEAAGMGSFPFSAVRKP